MAERFSQMYSDSGIKFVSMHPGWTGLAPSLPSRFSRGHSCVAGPKSFGGLGSLTTRSDAPSLRMGSYPALWLYPFALRGFPSNGMLSHLSIDTEGVKVALPGFSKTLATSLRSLPQGADTITWLAMADGKDLVPGGFYLDRSPQVEQPALSTLPSGPPLPFPSPSPLTVETPYLAPLVLCRTSTCLRPEHNTPTRVRWAQTSPWSTCRPLPSI